MLSAFATPPIPAKPASLAKSRLKKSGLSRSIDSAKPNTLLRNESNIDKKLNVAILLKTLQHYQSKLPTLGISIFFMIALYIFVSIISPIQVQNFLFANSFLPFLGLVFFASFFFFSFLFLHTRRGFFTAIGLTVLVWIKTSGTYPFWWHTIFVIGWLSLIELSWQLLLRLKLRDD